MPAVETRTGAAEAEAVGAQGTDYGARRLGSGSIRAQVVAGESGSAGGGGGRV